MIVILLIIEKIKIFKILHQDPIELGHARPIELGIWRRTQDNWVLPRTQDNWALCHDPMLHVALGRLQCEGPTQAPPGTWVLANGSIGYCSPIATWRSGLDASAPTHMCVYIIMCVINIIFSLIIQSIHIKNIITFIITRSIDIKNIIICVVIILEILNIIIYVINIIIFIIINSMNIKNIIICVINIIIFIIINKKILLIF